MTGFLCRTRRGMASARVYGEQRLGQITTLGAPTGVQKINRGACHLPPQGL